MYSSNPGFIYSRFVTRPTDDNIRHRLVGKNRSRWFVIHEDDLQRILKDTIVEGLWLFTTAYMAKKTGIDESVFVLLHSLGEDAQLAIQAIVKGTCTIDTFVREADIEHSHGHFLSTYDDNEYCIEVNGTEYFCYRLE